MIERIKYSTIADIYVRKLIFYKKREAQKLKKMCNSWGITYLPSENKKNVFKLDNDTFIKSELTPDIICSPSDKLFDWSTISKFESGNHDEVLFAIEDGTIKGVVHIVDFNKEFIFIEFYKLFHRFERMLRLYLQEKNESNDSLLNWMKTKTNDTYWSRKYGHYQPKDNAKRKILAEKRKELEPFQSFDLSDLLEFISDKEYLSEKFNRSVEQVGRLRNWIAHNNNITHKKSDSFAKPLYKIEELKIFIDSAIKFFNSYEELESKVKSTEFY